MGLAVVVAWPISVREEMLQHQEKPKKYADQWSVVSYQ